MKKYLLILMITIAAMESCKSPEKKEKNYAIVNLSKDDRMFLALKDTAQKHISEFTDSLKRHGSDEENYRFIVKSDFAENGIHEHMWSQVSSLKGGRLQGMLVDSPFNIKKMKTYDKVNVILNDVEDWVIYDKPHQRKIGDYSTRYLESKQ
jgi:uncharacterized protein YegJ (DUF2314 family)